MLKNPALFPFCTDLWILWSWSNSSAIHLSALPISFICSIGGPSDKIEHINLGCCFKSLHINKIVLFLFYQLLTTCLWVIQWQTLTYELVSVVIQWQTLTYELVSVLYNDKHLLMNLSLCYTMTNTYLWTCLCGYTIANTYLWTCLCGYTIANTYLWTCLCGYTMTNAYLWTCLCGYTIANTYELFLFFCDLFFSMFSHQFKICSFSKRHCSLDHDCINRLCWIKKNIGWFTLQ